MTTMSEPPKQSFRLSQLIYDTRYRSLTIQVIASILILAAFAWLVNNTAQNLAALGKPFSFSFLGNQAGYDINQRLIEYDSQDTHARAALVGILNTLLVAALGCLLATIIGVFVGVLRLSKNWIVSRLMAVYVEGFRNVPLLLWIVVIFAFFTEGLPQPRDFRGDEPEASMLLGDSVAFTNRGTYIPRLGFNNSLGGNDDVEVAEGEDPPPPGQSRLDWLLIIGVFAASVFASSQVTRRADRIQQQTGDRPTTWYLKLGLLIVPTAIVLVVLGAEVVNPYLQGFNFTEGVFIRNSLAALWLALSLYTAAFIAEIVRAGIMAVNKGQTEAAFALGIKPSRTMSLVILPQALRVIIPPLISQYLNLTKNSSLGLAVGYMDVRSTLGGITVNQTGKELEALLLLGGFYLILSLTISGVMNIYNNSVKLKER